ncbi:hypothetical protein BVRB_5g116680 [Beta vulgaris subsp. vulgaris]|nr:hypothetical protein BVRB_5g116680 [Beta vulgaris subsp. vulgaris]
MSTEERVITLEEEDESPSNTTTTTFNHRHRCCFNFPYFCPTSTRHVTLGGSTTSSLSDQTPSFWTRFRTADTHNRWWARPFKAFKKIREWSEIVAGPKWKTFIRQFNRRRHNHRHHHHHHNSNGKFQYDPLSYALNFDEGPGQNGHFDEDYNGHFPDFSSRFAGVQQNPLSSTPNKSPVDFDKDAPEC